MSIINSKLIYQKITIKAKLIALVFFILLGSFALQAYINAKYVKQDMEKLLSVQQFAVASYIANDVDSKLKIRISSLMAAANSLDPLLLTDAQRARSYLKQHDVLQLLFKGGVVLLNKQGRGVADYPVVPQRQGSQFNHLEYFSDILLTGKPVIGMPRIGRLSKLAIVPISVPIKDATGQLIGVLVGFSTLSDPSLFGQVEKATFGYSGYVAIDVPKYGIIATSSDKSRILDKMAAPGVNKMLDKFVAGYEGSGIAVNSKGVETLTSAKLIPSAGWIAQVVLPTQEAFAPARAMQWRFYQIAAVLSPLAIFLAWFLLRCVLFPLTLATSQIHQMMMGASALQTLPVTGQDEVSVLLTSFNALIEQRNEVEKALAHSEQTLRTIVETEPECVKLVSLEGILLKINPAGLAMIEADREDQLIGKKVSCLVVPEHQSAFNALAEKNAQGQSGVLEFEIVGLKGTRRWLDTHSVPMKNAQGEIMGILSITRDITEKKIAEHELKRLAQTDMLTGLANRHHFMMLAEQALAHAMRDSHKLSVLMMDIDYFKRVNDTYGHHGGDLVIKKLGQLCQENLRPTIDLVGRIGGEEFAIVLPETDTQQAMEVAERLCQTIAQAQVPIGQGPPLRFTVSVGVASLERPNTRLDALLACADQSLYAAKSQGRNRVCQLNLPL